MPVTKQTKKPLPPVPSFIPRTPTPPLRPVPKNAPPPSSDLSIEEKAACFDQLQAIHLEAMAIQADLDKLHFKLRGLVGKRENILEKGARADRTGNQGEPCSNCGFVGRACICERG